MHAVGGILRPMMVYTKPWQRNALSGAIVVLGLTLVVLGQVKGVVLVALGGLMIIGAIRHRIVSRRGGQQQPDGTNID